MREAVTSFMTQYLHGNFTPVGRSSLVVQRVKDLARSLPPLGSLLWHGFSSCPGNIHVPWSPARAPPRKIHVNVVDVFTSSKEPAKKLQKDPLPKKKKKKTHKNKKEKIFQLSPL